MTNTYTCWDLGSGTGNAITIDADSVEEAAREYVNSGDWDMEEESTYWIDVYVALEDSLDDYTVVKISVHPIEPYCETDYDHLWSTTNTYGNNGGVIHKEVCETCGLIRTTNTWATDYSDGTQGLRKISYSD